MYDYGGRMTIATKIFSVMIIALAIVCGMPMPAQATDATEPATAILAGTLGDCAYEDSTDCAWDARGMGNGLGTGFVALNVGSDDIRLYADGSTETAPTGYGVSVAVNATYRILSARLPLCEQEDSTGCRWDAANEGNGVGMSFVAFTHGDHTVLIYADNTYAIA